MKNKQTVSMNVENWIEKAGISSDIWDSPLNYYNFLLNETNQKKSFDLVINKISNLNKSNLVVADLGVGIAWTSIHLSELDCINKIFAVDLSIELLNKSLRFYIEKAIGNPSKVKPIVGSFSMLNNLNCKVDIIICNASIHHSSQLDTDIENISSYLNEDGILILSNEMPISSIKYFYYALRKITRFTWKMKKGIRLYESISQGSILYNDLGDHHILLKLYKYLFEKSGFKRYEIERTNYYPYLSKHQRNNLNKLVNFYVFKN